MVVGLHCAYGFMLACAQVGKISPLYFNLRHFSNRSSNKLQRNNAKSTQNIQPQTFAASESVSYPALLLVRERSALSDPYCQSMWMCVGMWVCVCVCPSFLGQISRKPRELGGLLLWGAYRKVAGAIEW